MLNKLVLHHKFKFKQGPSQVAVRTDGGLQKLEASATLSQVQINAKAADQENGLSVPSATDGNVAMGL
jgi:hypothetical protein